VAAGVAPSAAAAEAPSVEEPGEVLLAVAEEVPLEVPAAEASAAPVAVPLAEAEDKLFFAPGRIFRPGASCEGHGRFFEKYFKFPLDRRRVSE